MANDRNRMMDDTGSAGGGSRREGGMADDRMRGGPDSPGREDREGANPDEVRGIADEGSDEFEDAEDMDEDEEEEEEREEGSF